MQQLELVTKLCIFENMALAQLPNNNYKKTMKFSSSTSDVLTIVNQPLHNITLLFHCQFINIYIVSAAVFPFSCFIHLKY